MLLPHAKNTLIALAIADLGLHEHPALEDVDPEHRARINETVTAWVGQVLPHMLTNPARHKRQLTQALDEVAKTIVRGTM